MNTPPLDKPITPRELTIIENKARRSPYHAANLLLVSPEDEKLAECMQTIQRLCHALRGARANEVTPEKIEAITDAMYWRWKEDRNETPARHQLAGLIRTALGIKSDTPE